MQTQIPLLHVLNGVNASIETCLQRLSRLETEFIQNLDKDNMHKLQDVDLAHQDLSCVKDILVAITQTQGLNTIALPPALLDAIPLGHIRGKILGTEHLATDGDPSETQIFSLGPAPAP